MTVRLINADVMDGLAQLPDDSVHCCVTSPPYWGLRCYGTDGQIGLEPTLAEHIAKLVEVFAEIRRVLRPDGVCFVNYGDAYATQGGRGEARMQELGRPSKAALTVGQARGAAPGVKIPSGLKAKDNCLIPERLAIALQEADWWIRDRIIWAKPNPMPSSVTDRCTPSYELIYMLTKKARYFWDQEAVREKSITGDMRRPYGSNGAWELDGRPEHQRHGGEQRNGENAGAGRNLRNVWTFATEPFPAAHFATYPTKLVARALSAACPEKVCAECGAPWVREVETEFVKLAQRTNTRKALGADGQMADINSKNQMGFNKTKTLGFSPSCDCQAGTAAGTALDPFGGSGTTGLVADRMGRNAVLIELSADYCDMARRRIEGDAPLFATVEASP